MERINDLDSRLECLASRQYAPRLPALCILNIFRHLSTADLARCSSVCKEWYAVSKEAELWDTLTVNSCRHRTVGLAALNLMLQDRRPSALLLGNNDTVRRSKGCSKFHCVPNPSRSHEIPALLGQDLARLVQGFSSLRRLSLHESCTITGGFSDEFALCLAASPPCLESLSIGFHAYSLASERFTDDGVLHLCGVLTSLRHLTLDSCTSVTNRSLYAIACNLKALECLTLNHYSDALSSHGMQFVLERCSHLSHLRLHAGLLKLCQDMLFDETSPHKVELSAVKNLETCHVGFLGAKGPEVPGMIQC